MAETTPGQVITPGGGQQEPPKQPAPPQQEVAVSIPQTPQPAPNQGPTPLPQSPQVTQPVTSVPQSSPPSSPSGQPSVPVPVPLATQQSPDATEGFTQQFQSSITESLTPDLSQNEYTLSNEEDQITWSASEYIAHQKNSGWYMALGGAALAFSAIVYVLTKDFVSVAVILIAAVIFGFYAGRQPRVQQYTINPAGIGIGGKMYGFDQMKTFSITQEGAFSSITFWPMKRFMPAVSIYYDPQDEEKIVTYLSNFLPMDTEKRDPIDNLMRKIRF